MSDINTTVVGIENLSGNATANYTLISEVQDLMVEGVGNQMAGSYSIVGFILLAMFIYILYKSEVSVDVGVAFMTPALFIFGKYGLLPGGAGTTYGLLLGVGGLLFAGLIRYFR